MNRWLCLSFALLFAVSACDDKDDKSSADRRAVEPAKASTAATIEGARPDETLLNGALAYANSAPAPTDDGAAAAGNRFFDGAALIKEGFAAPGGDGAVFAGAAGSPRSRPLLTRPARRRPSDSTSAEPPSPDDPAASGSAARGAGNVLAAFDGFQKRMFDAAAPILSRAGWRAAKRRGTAVAMAPTHVTVHHTDGPQTMTEAATAAAVRSIQGYHMGAHEWDDIGYHFLIDGAGRVIEGRPAETVGAHTLGANSANIGVAMMGNFDKIQPTAEQVESLTRLVSFLALKYRQDPSRPGFLEGHRHYNNTDCPGKNMMAILDSIRARIDAETLRLAARLKDAPKGEFVPVLTDA